MVDILCYNTGIQIHTAMKILITLLLLCRNLHWDLLIVIPLKRPKQIQRMTTKQPTMMPILSLPLGTVNKQTNKQKIDQRC